MDDKSTVTYGMFFAILIAVIVFSLGIGAWLFF